MLNVTYKDIKDVEILKIIMIFSLNNSKILRLCDKLTYCSVYKMFNLNAFVYEQLVEKMAPTSLVLSTMKFQSFSRQVYFVQTDLLILTFDLFFIPLSKYIMY